MQGLKYKLIKSQDGGRVSKLKLVGHTHKKGPVQFITEFEEWKIKIKNSFPPAKLAWDHLSGIIRAMQAERKITLDLIKKEREVLSKLKTFIEENLVIMDKLEKENIELKDKLNVKKIVGSN